MQHLWQSQDKVVRSLGAGTISACLFLLALTTGLFFLTPFSMVPLFYNGIRDGYYNVCLSSVFSLLIIICIGRLDAAIIFCLLFGLPALYICYKATKNYDKNESVKSSNLLVEGNNLSLLNHQLLKLPDYFTNSSNYEDDKNSKYWYSNGYMISIVAQIALMIAIIFTLLISTIDSQQELINLYKTAKTIDNKDAVLSDAVLKDSLKLYRLAPGIIGIFVFVSYTISGLIAQFILIHQGQNTRPAFTIVDFKLPVWLWVSLVIGLVIGLCFDRPIINQLSMNVVLVLLAVFMLQGMSIIYVFCQQLPYKIMWLVGFCFLTFRLPWMTIVVVSIGVFEPWLGWRQKIKNNIRS